MKLRWKFLMIGLLTVMLCDQTMIEHTALLGGNDEPTVSDVLGFYQEYNQEFFGNKLPQNTIVDFSESDGAMARTTLYHSGRYHIGLNLKYSSANRTARLMILHEMCHIKNFVELYKNGEDHGPHWRACMLALEMQGANRVILIDGYEGQ